MRLRLFAVLGAALTLPVFAASALAQSYRPPQPDTPLSEKSRAKLAALRALNTLPADGWRMHAGDLPHGEATTLDDSAWTEVKAPYTGPVEAIWFRRRITVPKTLSGYDISGSRILFQFRAGANGPVPQIIYFNGRRVALGDDLEPVVLFQPAKPGDTVEVAVKLLPTVDVKHFDGARLAIEAVEPANGKPARPSPEDMRQQCLAIANIVPGLPGAGSNVLTRVEEAIGDINMQALAAGNQVAFDASLRKAQGVLDTLRPEIAKANITLAGNSHIDAAWLWPASETVDVVKRTFSTALQLMNEYPSYTYTQSAAQYSEWIADKYPELNEQIRKRIKEGRWEIVGGMWVEPDLNLPGGEALVRQLLVGQRYFQKQYGVTARIGWNPDSFGYNWQLPQIYKRSGLDYFVTQKMHWNDTNQLPFRLFWWQSPDGSKVLTYFPTDYVHDDVKPARIGGDFAESEPRNPGMTDLLDLYGIGDHGGGPTRAMLDEAEHYIAAGTPGAATPQLAIPTMHYGTAQHYFSTVEAKLNAESPTWNYDELGKGPMALPVPPAGAVSLPTWKDELYFEFHRGVFTTQANHKHNMRSSEMATLNAEKLASLAWLNGAAYPNDIFTDNWRKITFNGFHDLAAGSGIAVIYRDAQKDYDKIFTTDTLIADSSMDTLASRIDTRVKGATPILLFNPLAWKRAETVALKVQLPEHSDSIRILDDNNKPVPSQVLAHDAATNSFTVLAHVDDVPSVGYKLLHAQARGGDGNDDSKKLVKVTDTPDGITLENSALRVSVDRKTGCITALADLKSGLNTIAPNGCGNELQTFVDTPKEYDAWNIDPGTLDHHAVISGVDSVAVTGQGPLRSTIEIHRHWQSSKFVQRISLDAGADSVEIGNDIDWHETHVLLKAAFPIAAQNEKATYEIPYGSIERPTTRANSFEKARFEVPAQHWADFGDAKLGLSILNDAKYGYDDEGNVLRLTLLRSPASPDPDADRGHQSFRYALYPHAGTWKTAGTIRHGYEYNNPIAAVQVAAHEGSMPKEHSFVSVDNPNVILTAVKKAEDSDALIVRMYEWAGQAGDVKLHLPPGATAASATNLMEKPEGSALSVTGDTVTAPITPFQILTVQVNYLRAPAPMNVAAAKP